jgi:glycosyltransferase involved in cell wall biosynthesis
VNNQIRLGGAETVIRQLLRNFPEARLAVADGKAFPAEVQPLYPRPLARLYHSRLHRFFEGIAPRDRWTDRAFRKLATGSEDIIHLHNFHGRYASIESLAAVAMRKPIVWTFHALWGVTGGCDHPRDCRRFTEACGDCPQLGRWPLGTTDETSAQLAAKAAQLADLPLHIVAPSHWIAERIQQSRVGRKWRVHWVPNSVDAEFTAALPTEVAAGDNSTPPTILIVNRNFRDEQKGFPIARSALDQFAAASVSRPGRDGLQPLASALPRLLLVGENSDWAADELEEWDCESTAYVSDAAALAALYARATILLFASPAENFPCTILEAMAAGCCIVATPTGGVIEQIEDGASGILAEAISGPALAIALARACDDAALRRTLGRTARARAGREFSEAVFIARHWELYEEVLRDWRAPA